VTDGIARAVANQPLECIFEVMESFCQPIADQIVAHQEKGATADERDHETVAGSFNRDDG
jgi:hypothetical protein